MLRESNKKICLLISVGADVVVVVAVVVTMDSDEASFSEVEVSIGDTGCCTDAAVLFGGTIAVAVVTVVTGASVTFVTLPSVTVVTGTSVTVGTVPSVTVVTGASVTVVTVPSVTVDTGASVTVGTVPSVTTANRKCHLIRQSYRNCSRVGRRVACCSWSRSQRWRSWLWSEWPLYDVDQRKTATKITSRRFKRLS